MAKWSYVWFEKCRKTKGLELAQQQIIKALDTVTLLHQAVQSLAQEKERVGSTHTLLIPNRGRS